jgi:hypothetical protein
MLFLFHYLIYNNHDHLNLYIFFMQEYLTQNGLPNIFYRHCHIRIKISFLIKISFMLHEHFLI